MNKKQWDEEITKTIIGASKSVDVVFGFGKNDPDPSVFTPFLSLVDERLRKRAVIASGKRHEKEELKVNIIRKLQDAGWEIRLIFRRPQYSMLIVDEADTFVLHYPSPDSPREYTMYRVGPQPTEIGYLNVHAQHFQSTWFGSSDITLIFDRLGITHKIQQRIHLEGEKHWDAVFQHFLRNPKAMREMHHREFEEFIAELCVKDGMDVELTPPRNDGGRDILARMTTPMGSHLYLVECKRRKVENPVGVQYVRALYGVLKAQRGTKGMIVTTSRFTKGALEFFRDHKYELGSKDFDSIVAWIERLFPEG